MSYVKDFSISFPTQTRGKAWLDGIYVEPPWTETTRVATAARSRTGERLPNWREIIARGEDATTNLTGTWDVIDYRPLGKRIEQNWSNPAYPTATGRRWLEGDLEITNTSQNIFAQNPSLSTSFVDNLARAAFYKKLHKEATQFQGLVFLGELRETLHLLRNPVKSLHNLADGFLGTLRKRKRASPKTWVKDASSVWLEQAFGWKPLLNDIENAVTAWQRLTEPNQSHRVTAGAKKTFDRSGELSNYEKVGASWTPNSSGIYCTNIWCKLMETHTVRYRGAVRAQVEAPTWKDATLFGFSPLEFVPAAWELLPWSFLVDYFTNIGDILDASVTSTRDITYVDKAVIRMTEKYRHFVTNKFYLTFGSGWSLRSHSDSSVRKHGLSRKEVTRTKGSGISVPDFQFNFSLSDGQLGNCAALLAQANSLFPQRQPRRWHR
jgi:hypothetical protein